MIVHRRWHWGAAAGLLVGAAIAGVAYGTVSLGVTDVVAALAGRASDSTREIVLALRVPRVLLAALVGIALATSGAALQATLRNVLAEPYLLGVSGGAAVGAVTALVLRLPLVVTPIAAFGGAAIAVMLALGVAQGSRSSSSHVDVRTMLMAGVVIGAFANAVIMIVLANVPADTIRGALWWMMGSVADASLRSVGALAIYVAIGVGYLYLRGPAVDVLTLGEESAAALGVDVDRLTQRIFLASALLAAASVAAAGLVGFVGLIVPHIVRGAGLSRQRPIILGAALVGATLVIASDLVARVALRPTELPLGAVTAILGVPFFLFQLRRAT